MSDAGRALVDVSPLHASLVSRLVPSQESGSDFFTRFEAFALPTVATWEEVHECKSTGQLERMLHHRLSVSLESEPGPGGGVEPEYSWFPTVNEQKVRVTQYSGRQIVGTVFRIQNDGLLVRTSHLETVPLMSLSCLEVERHGPSKALTGVVLGGLAGAAGGWVSTRGGGSHWESQGRMLGPTLRVMFGALLGAWIGEKIRGPYWARVSLSGGGAPPGRP